MIAQKLISFSFSASAVCMGYGTDLLAKTSGLANRHGTHNIRG